MVQEVRVPDRHGRKSSRHAAGAIPGWRLGLYLGLVVWALWLLWDILAAGS
ncbi:MAG: hypothetical protein HYY08_03975 [Firmicutes bacterium]|nr:hypothetical protein [Bacillota bacterium]